MGWWRSTRSIAREIDEELEAHLTLAADELCRTGLSPKQARRAAERAFGERDAIRAACLAAHPRPRRYLVAATVVGVCLLGALAMKPLKWSRVSPFTAVARSGPQVHVVVPQLGEYELLAIDDLAVGDILEHCTSRFADRCDKRFAEDLVEVLRAMGHDPGPKVDLRLRDPSTGAELIVRGQEMTRENRRAVWKSRNLDAS